MGATRATGTNPRWRHAFGAAAEDVAARHLEARGCVVLERRFRGGGGEVDIVARSGTTLIFVEVKARASHRYGVPAAAVGARKQRRIAAAARAYLGRFGCAGRCRFDVVGVSGGDGAVYVHWIKDAFRC